MYVNHKVLYCASHCCLMIFTNPQWSHTFKYTDMQHTVMHVHVHVHVLYMYMYMYVCQYKIPSCLLLTLSSGVSLGKASSGNSSIQPLPLYLGCDSQYILTCNQAMTVSAGETIKSQAHALPLNSYNCCIINVLILSGSCLGWGVGGWVGGVGIQVLHIGK